MIKKGNKLYNPTYPFQHIVTINGRPSYVNSKWEPLNDIGFAHKCPKCNFIISDRCKLINYKNCPNCNMNMEEVDA